MGKFSKKKQKQKRAGGKILLLAALVILLSAIVFAVGILKQREIPVLELGSVPAQSADVLPEGDNTTAVEVQPATEAAVPQTVELEEGLQLHYIGKYAGLYMEDGTNEAVANVMMMILENTGSNDLQLARISAAYSDFTAEFEVTNLPAGEKVVLLEKNRHEATEEAYQGIQLSNVVYFPEKMSLQEDIFKIEGNNGTLKVTNVSGRDVDGDIYIYYKNSASDLLYGGITYRVVVRGGLKAGQNNTVIAGHYAPDSCRILHVTNGN